jgi:hypothetical protein
VWRAKRPAAPCFLQMPPANKIDPSMEKRIQAQLRAKKGMLAIARDLKVGTGTVQRIKREMEARGPFDGAAAA